MLLPKNNIENHDDEWVNKYDKVKADNFINHLCKKLDNSHSSIRRQIEISSMYGQLSYVIMEPWYATSNYIWQILVQHEQYVVNALTNKYMGLSFLINKNESYRPVLLYIYWKYVSERQASLDWIKELSNAYQIGKKRIDTFFNILTNQIDNKTNHTEFIDEYHTFNERHAFIKTNKISRKIKHFQSLKKNYINIIYSNSKKNSVIQILTNHIDYRSYLEHKLNSYYNDMVFEVRITGLLFNKIKIKIKFL